MATKTGSGRARTAWSVAVGLLALVLATGSATAQTEPWRAIAIGESNDAAQQAELLAYFDAGDGDLLSTVSVDDTFRAMEGIFDLEGVDSAYSSTAMTCRQPGTGLEVTTRNIERVSPELYALALVTTGIEDAELVVAAPDDAPALGMTALTGVFASLDGAPCGPKNPRADRQRLALEGLALAAGIGRARDEEGSRAAATEVVLESQRAVVAGGLSEPGEIENVVLAREGDAGIELTADERTALVDLMTRLGVAKLDWGGFTGGWTTDRDEAGTRVAMVGTRAAVTIGVGGATQSEPTATAQAIATSQPPAASEAAETPEAAATPQATAPSLAVASPAVGQVATPPTGLPVSSPATTPDTAVPTAEPTEIAAAVSQAGPPDRTITGTVARTGDGGGLLVEVPNGERKAFAAADDGVVVTRDGAVARMADVQNGDRIQLSVDGRTGEMLRVDATPTATDEKSWLQRFGWLAAPLLILLAAAVFARKRIGAAVGSRGATIVKPARALVARRRTWIFGRRHGGAAGD